MTTYARLLVAACAAALPLSAAASERALTLHPLGTVATGGYRDEDPRIAEINAFDRLNRMIYVVNPTAGTLDALHAADPTAPVVGPPVRLLDDCRAALGATCPLRDGLEPNSVAIHGRLLAVAVANAPRTDRGHAVFYRLRAGAAPRFVAALEVGAGPDMIGFSEDGRYAVTADEGEPDASYAIDPAGSVSIIDLTRLGSRSAVRRAGFEAFDELGRRAALIAAGVRIFGPNATVSQDLEPEYVAIRKGKAYVTLQENNALAIVDLERATVERIIALGLKDHSRKGQHLDPSDRDGAIAIGAWPVHGMYQPDGIAAFTVRGEVYLVVANEGDAREYDGFSETARAGGNGYALDPAVFPDAAALRAGAALGRLTVTTATGDSNGDGLFERVEVFGGRSVSIHDAKGRRIWDSGDLLERLSATLDARGVTLFNTTSTANSRDNRSDDKGVEPESVAVGEVRGRPYAFVALERDGGLVVLDLSIPAAPRFVSYVNRRRLADPMTGAPLACDDAGVDCGDLGPEGLTFVPARHTPTGRPWLIVSNEVSSTTTIWEVR